MIARTAGDPAATLSAVRSAVTAIDATAKVDVSTLREAASTELNMRGVGTRMTGAIGIVGVLLAAIGLYGIVSYLVVSQTAELAIRLALGATSGHLLHHVLRRAIYVVGAGIAVGAVLSLLTPPALVVFLAGVSPADPVAFIAAAVLLVGVALVASSLPALRVSRIDPLLALRE